MDIPRLLITAMILEKRDFEASVVTVDESSDRALSIKKKNPFAASIALVARVAPSKANYKGFLRDLNMDFPSIVGKKTPQNLHMYEWS